MNIWAAVMLATMLSAGQSPEVPTTKRCWNLLDEAIHDKNPDVRKDAAESVSLLPVNQQVLSRLESMLHDPDVTVRKAVVSTLGDVKGKRTIPLLKQALSDPVPEVRFAAAKVLYHLQDPEGEQFLLAVVEGESKAASGYLNSKERTASHMLHTPSKLFMFAAVQAAGFVPVPGLGMGISSAQGILANPDSSARASALLLLAHSQDAALGDAVASALGAKQWSERAAAAHVVATHPFPNLRPRLIPLLDDKKWAVRLRSAAAYIRLGETPAAK